VTIGGEVGHYVHMRVVSSTTPSPITSPHWVTHMHYVVEWESEGIPEHFGWRSMENEERYDASVQVVEVRDEGIYGNK
jgi:hypothetical protein